MEGVVLLDNSVGVEIHGDGIVGLDCLVEAGSHTISLDDLSIRDCTVTGINHQENSKETNHTRDRKQCKLYENPTVENKNCLKTLFRTSFHFRKKKG
jgi:hypothetical protein